MSEDKQNYDKSLQRSVTVEVPVARAFSAFTDEFAALVAEGVHVVAGCARYHRHRRAGGGTLF